MTNLKYNDGEIPAQGPLPARPWSIAIPLLSQRVSKDWVKMMNLLGQTLSAIARQPHAPSYVYVGCHEVPDVLIPDGLRVRFVEVTFDPPRFSWEMEVDKLKKLEVLGALHRAEGAGLLYLLDADDVIDESFSRHVSNVSSKAIIISKGYRLNHATKELSIIPRFWRKCGSCALVDWSCDELPKSALTDESSVFRHFLDTRHFEWHNFFRDRGWSTSYINDPIVMYVTDHGQNDSEFLSKSSWRWRLYHAINPGKLMSPFVAERFGLNTEVAAVSGSIKR